MPTPSEHREWASRNERFAESLSGSEWSDWEMTALFYAAVHEVAAFIQARKPELAAHGIPFPTKHGPIIDVLTKHYPSIALPYDSIMDRGWKSRYRCKEYSDTDLKLARVQLQNLRDEIAKEPTFVPLKP
jgi:hypothetical protein